jgi:hypothetical protein
LIRNFDTLTDLWHGTAQSMLFATRKELDYVASIDTMLYDNVLSCDSMKFKFDLGRDLWLTPTRFTVLQRAYINPTEYASFLDRCTEIARGEEKRGVVTQMFAHQHARAQKRYRWGNCMLGWTFRGGGKYQQPTLAMHSRVSYIAYIGGLDLALCHVLARDIGDRVGLRPKDFAFRWYVDSLQFHGFKSIPYLFRHNLDGILRGDTPEYPSKDHPTLRLVRRWYGVMVDEHERGVPLEAQKYGPLRRIRRRYSEYLADPNHKLGISPPRCPIKNLKLNKL